ncbi:magnesium/cobalt transporter CorA [Cryomorphaceae bacterium 1068]|nr:magnesium/cobalt transporter CorA [Cryomorphaceae bacterium 1068]
MARFLKHEAKKIGTAPGSLIFVGNKRSDVVSIHAIRYNAESYESFPDAKLEEIGGIVQEGSLTWIDVFGLHDPDVIQAFGDKFNMHPLLQEDVLNTEQRPKYEEYSEHNTFILKMLSVDRDHSAVLTEQVSIVAGKNYLLCFQEVKGDVFESIRQRILNQTTKIRERDSDYLAFAMLDAIVDNYIVSIEYFGNEIENLEAEMLVRIEPEILPRINTYKREISSLRRIVRPVLEIVFQYEKSESPHLDSKTIPFIKDLQDHVVQATEAIEIYKELLNDELSFYHTSMSNRLNDTMRVLTVFSVIFIPLSFLSGVYGTNFKYFPELEYKYSYPIFWTLLISIACLMLYFFYRKKWL